MAQRFLGAMNFSAIAISINFLETFGFSIHHFGSSYRGPEHEIGYRVAWKISPNIQLFGTTLQRNISSLGVLWLPPASMLRLTYASKGSHMVPLGEG